MRGHAKGWTTVILGAALVLLSACHGSSGTSIQVVVSPSSITVPLLGSVQFSAAVSNATDTTVIWQVNGVTGGNSTTGTISINGVYTAPAVLPSGTTITITAISNQNSKAMGTATVALSSGVTISITPSGTITMAVNETLTFTATVTGSANQNANWFVNGTAGGSSTTGTITMTGQTAVYTAPATAPASSVTVSAQSVLDSSQSASALVTVVAATTPTLTSVSPVNIAQGSFFQDLYLTGAGFLSTTQVVVSGVALPSIAIGSTTLRARIPGSMLASAGTFTVLAKSQAGVTTSSLSINVAPVRPAMVSLVPATVPQGATTTLDVFGGFYLPTGATDLGGLSKPFSVTDSRHLQLTLGPGDLAVAGQYSLGVKNPSAPAPARSALNLTSQPVFSMPSTSIIPGFNQPVAIALNKATGVPVVVNQGNNTLAVLDPAFTTITANVPVGTKPTSVAVDSVRNLAFVTDNGSSAVDVVDLSGPTIAATLSCVGNAPVAVGVDEIHGRAIVVDQNTSAATILDTTPPLTCPTMTSPGSVLGTVNISTGANPQVAVDPELGWAIITPGGGGTLSVVDLVRQAVVFRVIVSAGIQGVAVNHETKELLLVDSTLATATLFSLLDQTTASLTLQLGNVAAAINPLTNVGLSVNPTTHQAFVVDLASPSLQGTVTVGTNPVAVTLDAATNKALVADATDNTVTVISLGPTRCTLGDPQILDVNPPAILTTGAAVPLTITGAGFSAGSQVRLDESLVSTTFVNSRTMMATVPVSFLTGPRRVVVEVRNPSGAISNASNLLVVQPVSVGNSPQGVAIDVNLDLGVVTNAGDGTVSIVDLTTGTVNSTISLGSSNTTVPQGVAVISRADRAVVANSGNSTAAIIDLTTNTAIGPISAGGQPAGVGISEDSGQAVVANSTTNTISEFSALATSAPVPSATTLDPQPIAVAVAPELNLAAITHGTANDVITVDISTGTPFFTHRIIGSQLPTGIAYDPDTQQFLVASSLTNLVQAINPQALTAFTLGVGVNPTALAYDYQIGELLTLNTASNTVTVVDFQSRRARDVFSFSGSPRFSVAIHSRLGIAVVADGPNNRVLLVPLPR